MELIANGDDLMYGWLFVVAVSLVVGILFLLTQYNTLKAIQPQNRTMTPGYVWLQLIPFFNLVWQFIVVSRIAESLRNEMSSAPTFSFDNDQQLSRISNKNEKPTYQIGIAYCTLFCVGLIPMIGSIFSLAGIVCWIIYWVKLSGCKKSIVTGVYPSPKADVLDPM